MWFTEADELAIVEAVENIGQEDHCNSEKTVNFNNTSSILYFRMCFHVIHKYLYSSLNTDLRAFQSFTNRTLSISSVNIDRLSLLHLRHDFSF